MGERLSGAPGEVSWRGGAVAFGTYEGIVKSASLGDVARGLRLGRVGALKEEKRWQWWGVMDEQVAAGAAIVRLGYASQVFFWCFDRAQGRMLCDHEVTLAPWGAQVSDAPGEGVVASFEGSGSSKGEVVRHGQGGAMMRGALGDAVWEIALEGECVTPVTAVCPVRRGRVNTTVKQSGLLASGWVEVAGRRYELTNQALGMLDYTHGLLERHTAWRWAIGAGVGEGGESLSFNLVSGFNEGLENVVWLGGVPRAVGPAQILLDRAHPEQMWRVEAEGVLLTLAVEGVRRASTDLVVVGSHYTQPIGVWSGEVCGVKLGRVWGVAEDHLARW